MFDFETPCKPIFKQGYNKDRNYNTVIQGYSDFCDKG